MNKIHAWDCVLRNPSVLGFHPQFREGFLTFSPTDILSGILLCLGGEGGVLSCVL